MLSSDLSCLNWPENEKKSECLCTTDVFPLVVLVEDGFMVKVM